MNVEGVKTSTARGFPHEPLSLVERMGLAAWAHRRIGVGGGRSNLLLVFFVFQSFSRFALTCHAGATIRFSAAMSADATRSAASRRCR